jgi:hypothetical protein
LRGDLGLWVMPQRKEDTVEETKLRLELGGLTKEKTNH